MKKLLVTGFDPFGGEAVNPAREAVLRLPDALGGYEITCVTELTRMLRRFEPGEAVSITVYRGGQELTLSITLDEKPREEKEPQEEQTQQPQQGFFGWDPFQGFYDSYKD